MNDLTAALIAGLVSLPLTAALVVAVRRKHTSRLKSVDEFARRANLAVTDDVSPALLDLWDRRVSRVAAASLVLVPFTAVCLTLGWRMDLVDRGEWLLLVVWYPALMLGLVAMDVRPRWPEATSAVLAHAQRVHLRDYLDPVLASFVAAQWLSTALYLVSAILTDHGSMRAAAAAGLAITGLFVIEFAVLSRRRLRQRVRAHTVQQLAFNDALTADALTGILRLMVPLGFPVLFVVGSRADESTVTATLHLIAFVFMLAAITASLRAPVRRRPGRRAAALSHRPPTSLERCSVNPWAAPKVVGTEPKVVGTDREMDDLARRADLAVTPDVEPGLRAFLKAREDESLSWWDATQLAAWLALVVFFVASPSDWFRAHLFTVFPFLLMVQCVLRGVDTFARPSLPDWPGDDSQRVTHMAQRGLRDYVDPWLLIAIGLACAWTAVAATVLAIVSDSPLEAWIGALVAACALLVPLSLWASSTRALRQSRRRARTVQQLAFDEAILGQTLTEHVRSMALGMAWLAPFSLANIEATPFWCFIITVLAWGLVFVLTLSWRNDVITATRSLGRSPAPQAHPGEVAR